MDVDRRGRPGRLDGLASLPLAGRAGQVRPALLRQRPAGARTGSSWPP
ncbi:MAG: hypothetical protein MZW92_10440 [Comamonadaceae bacterium]|nr:hypothetical protein [Comamonadaceae bacterium]